MHVYMWLMLMIPVLLSLFIFWFWMLIDCLLNKRIRDTQRVVWTIVIIVAGLVGSIIYFFAGRRPGVVSRPPAYYVRRDYRERVQRQTYRPYQSGYQAQVTPHPYHGEQVVPDEAPGQQAEYEQIQISYPEQ